MTPAVEFLNYWTVKKMYMHFRGFFPKTGHFLGVSSVHTYIINIAGSEAAIGEAGGAQRPFCLLMSLKRRVHAVHGHGTWGKNPPVSKAN